MPSLCGNQYAYLAVLVCLSAFGNVMAQNADGPRSDLDLPIREIVQKYYAGMNFYVGATPKGNFLETEDTENKKRLDLLVSEFSYMMPSNSFKQVRVYTHPDASWEADEYRNWIVVARKHGMVLRAHGPIGPQCSQWVKGNQRINGERFKPIGEDLLPVLERYMTELSKDLEKNKDVVKWMDVVNETVVGTDKANRLPYKSGDWFGPIDGKGFQNPWLKIGLDESTGVSVPLYVIRAFELSNKYAPSIKKLYNQHDEMEPLAWDKIKATIKFLRARGLKVDAVGWQAHVPLGWEKLPQNIKDFENLIDWCYGNDLEFHITELNVVRDPRLSKETAHEHAELFYALTAVMAKKAGRGAVGLNFWDFGSSNVRPPAPPRGGLFDNKLSRQSPQYLAVKRALLENAPKK